MLGINLNIKPLYWLLRQDLEPGEFLAPEAPEFDFDGDTEEWVEIKPGDPIVVTGETERYGMLVADFALSFEAFVRVWNAAKFCWEYDIVPAGSVVLLEDKYAVGATEAAVTKATAATA